ncbi:hypothetical protein HDU96_001451 [Phlyctochytrium bullatum]|nr:hypothetical protein HDU96_001451 [Phlyctochytrium bullatum]
MKDLTAVPPTPAPPHPHLDACLADIRSQLSADGEATTNPKVLARRSHDVSYHRACMPHAVVEAACEEDVVVVLRACNRYKVPVIARAGGTSLEGHTIPSPHHGGVVLDLSAMDRIVAIHPDDMDVVVEPGVGWMDLRDALEPHGLFFPPDPGAAACVGGMCGTNCSGTLAYRYGTMKDNVLSLRVVMADGTVVTTRRRAVKSSAGYDLTRLFVGSEGTLGVVTQATLRLRVLPTRTTVALAQFSHLASAAEAVQRLVRSGAPFHRLEILDEVCVRAVNLGIGEARKRFPELTTLLAECAGATPREVDAQLAVFRDVCGALVKAEGSGAGGVTVATDKAEGERLWDLRKKAFFAAPNLRPTLDGKCGVMVSDVAVPMSRLVGSLGTARKLLDEMGLVGPIVAHAGDGNYHVLLVVRTDDGGAEVEKAERFREEIGRLAIEEGGTCTGEHGIGEGKRELLEMEVGPEAIKLMRTLKDTLDPNHILNPGKVLLPWKKTPVAKSVGAAIEQPVAPRARSVVAPRAEAVVAAAAGKEGAKL